ncbi:MAG: MJ1477/TM1410 family putative glycoside hydrolase [Hyphomicrobiaceae bacterium]
MSFSELMVGLILVALAFAAGFLKGRSSRNAAPPPKPQTAPPSAAVPGKEPMVPPRPTPGRSARPKPEPKLEPKRQAARAAGKPDLATVKRWGYQLQDLDVKQAAASSFDLLVVDYARDGARDTALKPAEVARLATRPDGSRRLVLAYLSIGEAESYRFYWRKQWERQPPGWLLGENPDWDQNYAVRFWDRDWQALLYGNPDAYLDQILAQGFDGIYLDKCDVTEDLRTRERKAASERTDLDADMVDLVRRLAAYGRARRPGFLVVMQNAEPLLERVELRREIDAVAKEELFYGLEAAEKPNDRDEIEWARERLDLMRKDGKPVFVVEYLGNAAKIAKAAEAARDYGYVLYTADKSRELDRLRDDPPVA